ncbi:GAF domain-containing protein [Clostridium thermarum]|uniref:GAF domain-containing protein n=1 Tax=Clostridium thermarum TaxID=1716543 RepID=UPI00111CB70F|nr:GAF domain-containing protein [Clostridium thermarum]
MINVDNFKDMKIEDKYNLMLLLIEGQLKSESDFIANLSNTSAIIKSALEETNWVGFYLYKDGELVLGPFQGLPACCRIEIGSGVCGTAAKLKATQRVANVHEFDGHIACDSASNSEIVIPIIKDDKLLGVLDIDSPVFDRFSKIDQTYLEKAVEILVKYL